MTSPLRLPFIRLNGRRSLIICLKSADSAFLTSRRAKVNHHALVGGCLHTRRLRLAKTFDQPGDQTWSRTPAPFARHMGKVIELSGPVATQYTTTGNLLGHISIVVGKLWRKVSPVARGRFIADQPPGGLLRHVILAHHGLREYGSR